MKNENLSYAVIGGYALALHGLVRATMDVDLVISLRQEDFEKVEVAMSKIGLRSRLPLRASEVFKMRKEYIENRNLIAWSFVDFGNPARQADVVITKDFRKMDVKLISVAGRSIPVASLKELLKMKLEAGRPQDLVDVQNIRAKLNEKK